MKFSEYTLARADTGAVLPLCAVTVYRSDGVTLASLFASNGTTPISNPMTADANGKVSFCVADGIYILSAVAVGGGYTTPSIQVQIYDLQRIVDAVATTPETFNGVGDGTANDTAPLLAAIATGKDVFLKGVYLHTTTLTMANNDQKIYGPGEIKTSGAIDSITINGGVNGVNVACNFNSPGQTAGYAVKISDATRVNIEEMNIIDAYGALYVEKANTVHVDFLWGTTRGPGIKLFGNNSLYSDIVHFERATIDPGVGFYGFDCDGAVHTVTGRVGIVNGKGVIIRNTSGGTRLPAIFRVIFESDYSETDGIRIDAGQDIDLTDSYALGAIAGSGLYVGAAINDREVRVSGGKYEGNSRYGIENAGGVILYAANSRIVSNTLGAISGNVWTEGYRFALDANAYLIMSGSNPQRVFDGNDYDVYDRAGNNLLTYIGGIALQTISAAGVGYATGSGGAITQITSRSTGVILNTVCGAITLISAAGTASWTTITVTNSKVAATDIIKLSQKSGTDKYMLHVTKVLAGSFDISFATTGGTTTEQPVFNFTVSKAVAA